MEEKKISKYLQSEFGTDEKLADRVAMKITKLINGDKHMWIDTSKTLPEPQSIYESGNDYYLVKTEHFGQRRAMYLINDLGECAWYTSYIEKLIVPVISFMPLIED